MKTINYSVFCLALFQITGVDSVSQPAVKMEKPTAKQVELAVKLGRPVEGLTRIIFTRQSGMLGAIVPHLVADRGDSTEYNALVIQDEIYADFDGNFDKARNVTQLYLKDENNKFHLIQGTPIPGDKLLTDEKDRVTTTLKFPGTVEGKPEFDIKHVGVWELGQNAKANIRLTGVVKSGDIAGWDRKPGKVRIEVIVPNGDQGFCPAFDAEAGVTYFVDYYYMKASYIVTELR
ncbi:MAG TPA: hypothetical protein PLR88_08180 [Bacteroidales bacterium]|nr:hypothetical protein [Bacteroidales bacterium]